MSNSIGDLDLEDAAKEAAGNWKRWNSFAWFRDSELERPQDWFIYYSHHRDSTLLDRSNCVQIDKALRPFIDAESDDPDVIEEDHSHFLVGWIRGWSVRVYRNGEITEAFKVLAWTAGTHGDLSHSLNEHHYGSKWNSKQLGKISHWQPEALRTITSFPMTGPTAFTNGSAINRCNALESRDDQGGWPDEDDFRAAFDALGYPAT
jgi:hypothetical protein